MYKSKELTKSKFSLGGITMRFVLLIKRALHSRYRRKPLYLLDSFSSYDLCYLVLLSKLN